MADHPSPAPTNMNEFGRVFNIDTSSLAQSGTGETTGFVAGGGTTATDASTFTGNLGSTAYRISDIVKALKTLGFLAR